LSSFQWGTPQRGVRNGANLVFKAGNRLKEKNQLLRLNSGATITESSVSPHLELPSILRKREANVARGRLLFHEEVEEIFSGDIRELIMLPNNQISFHAATTKQHIEACTFHTRSGFQRFFLGQVHFPKVSSCIP